MTIQLTIIIFQFLILNDLIKLVYFIIFSFECNFYYLIQFKIVFIINDSNESSIYLCYL
jgi:hypothetical protein